MRVLLYSINTILVLKLNKKRYLQIYYTINLRVVLYYTFDQY